MAGHTDFASIIPDLVALRRDLHAHPEVGFQVERTADLVARRLQALSFDEVVPGFGRTGVVGVLRGRGGPGTTTALRADMDALPIAEATGLPYASTRPGVMHACGHDGHTTMLMGAAHHLAIDRTFAGNVVFVFQPAEEADGGAKAMIEDGLFERFGVERVFGIHNMPGLPVGHFATRPGSLMASADFFQVTIEGQGAHASTPHLGIDPACAVANIIHAFQGLVSREMSGVERVVVSTTTIEMGTAVNVIAGIARMTGSVRTLSLSGRGRVEQLMRRHCDGIAMSTGTRIDLAYTRDLPVTTNDPVATAAALSAARRVSDHVDGSVEPVMWAEDFSHMLDCRPGAFMFVGNGNSAPVHNPFYDFNDEAIPFGVAYLVNLITV